MHPGAATGAAGPVTDLPRLPDRASDGDLTQRVDSRRDDEAGQLADAFNRFVEKVATTIRGIAESTTRLKDAAQQMTEVSTRRQNGKELARQTAEATEQITARIASAVEQQTATTSEMTRTVQGAAISSADVAGTITGVADIASETVGGARTTQQAAANLSDLAADLTRLVGAFRF